jgi:hypothetical protein
MFVDWATGLSEKREGIDVTTKTRGRQAGGRNARYAATRLLPRLALWAGVGVFVCGGMMTCDNTTEPGPAESGSLYVAAYSYTWPRVQRRSAKTGEIRQGFNPDNFCISADVDTETGDVFAYIFNYITRYTPGGRLKFETYAWTRKYSGREYIDLNEKTRIIYFLNGEGMLFRFDADTGEDLGILLGTVLGDAEQLLVDDDENRIWIIAKGGADVRKFSPQPDLLLILRDGPYTKMRVEPESNTLIMGVIKNGANYLYRYTKGGVKKKEIAIGVKPTNLAVEPGSGVIWVSDGATIERYAADGVQLEGIPTAGFDLIDFGTGGGAAFTLDGGGYLTAYNTRDLNVAWREKRFSKYDEIHFLKYNEK